jgi:hypothetical protein
LVDILRGQRESLSAEVGIAFGAAVTRAVSDVLGTLSFARGIALGDKAKLETHPAYFKGMA